MRTPVNDTWKKKVLDALVLPAHVVSKIQSTKYN